MNLIYIMRQKTTGNNWWSVVLIADGMWPLICQPNDELRWSVTNADAVNWFTEKELDLNDAVEKAMFIMSAITNDNSW